jgi:hypothetical protein
VNVAKAFLGKCPKMCAGGRAVRVLPPIRNNPPPGPPRPTRPCKRCDRPFVPYPAYRVCCPGCPTSYRPDPLRSQERSCRACGDTFTPTGERGPLPTRCPGCQARSRVPLACPLCGDRVSVRYGGRVCAKCRPGAAAATQRATPRPPVTCPGCATRFTPTWPNHRYCSPACRNRTDCRLKHARRRERKRAAGIPDRQPDQPPAAILTNRVNIPEGGSLCLPAWAP